MHSPALFSTSPEDSPSYTMLGRDESADGAVPLITEDVLADERNENENSFVVITLQASDLCIPSGADDTSSDDNEDQPSEDLDPAAVKRAATLAAFEAASLENGSAQTETQPRPAERTPPQQAFDTEARKVALLQGWG